MIVGLIAIVIVSSGGGAGDALSTKLTQIAGQMMPGVVTEMKPVPRTARAPAYKGTER